MSQELPNLSEARGGAEEEEKGKEGSKKSKAARHSRNGSSHGVDDGRIPPATYKFRLYSGKVLELFAGDLYNLDGKMCEGIYTGDDFCDVSMSDDSCFKYEMSEFHFGISLRMCLLEHGTS